VHASVARLREVIGRAPGDRAVYEFETALAEIGANVLTHGTPPGSTQPVAFSLRWDGATAVATFVDSGPPAHDQLSRAVPAPTSEGGRGLALARMLLDELGYGREGSVNTWRLVKRL